jgi:hypothetical protein
LLRRKRGKRFSQEGEDPYSLLIRRAKEESKRKKKFHLKKISNQIKAKQQRL